MKTKSVFKILLDVALAALFLSLYLPFSTGLLFHEIAGLFIFLLVIVHVVLNGKWVRSLFSATHSAPGLRRIVAVVINISLALLGLTVVISGVLNSSALFTWQTALNTELLGKIHAVSVYALAGMLAMHLLLHLKYLAGMFRGIARNLRQKPVRRTIAGFAAALALAAFSYTQLAPILELRNLAAFVPPASEPETSSAAQNPDTQEADKSDSAASDGDSSSASDPPVTLNEFLGKLICNGCGKHCSLLSPRCGKGERQAAVAEQEYEALYYQELVIPESDS